MTGCFENNITIDSVRAQRLKASMERLRHTTRARAYAKDEMAYFVGRCEWHQQQLPFDMQTYPPDHPTLLWRRESIIEATACIQICVEYLLTLED